jgi:O-antigen biosynthesis protein WbqP
VMHILNRERCKRGLDFSLAVSVTIPALMVCGLLCMLIYFVDGVPPIFRQTRVGMHNKTFKLYKLRTMNVETRQVATHEIEKSHITRTGAFLRRIKVDELPQIFNVLNGTMSFVGPRPCLPSQVELITARTNLGVMAVRPGITGPSQIKGLDMSTPLDLAASDATYLTNWSLYRDLTYLFATVVGAGRGDAIDTRTQ